MITSKHTVHPIETFSEIAVELLKHLKTTRQPILLTANGKPAAVVQDPAAYQRLVDAAGEKIVAAAIGQAMHDLASGAAPSLHDGLAEVGLEPGVL